MAIAAQGRMDEQWAAVRTPTSVGRKSLHSGVLRIVARVPHAKDDATQRMSPYFRGRSDTEFLGQRRRRCQEFSLPSARPINPQAEKKFVGSALETQVLTSHTYVSDLGSGEPTSGIAHQDQLMRFQAGATSLETLFQRQTHFASRATRATL
jgi:hypothetical protein